MTEIKQDKIRVGIIGATGYVGMELARLLYRHPYFEITALCSRSSNGTAFSSLYPAFKGLIDIELSPIDPKQLAETCDVAITALPHGVSAQIVPQLLAEGLKVLDHSGDFRFKDVETYERAYNLEHPRPDLLKEAVYGLPELYREELKQTRLISNPGCYPTCTVLALAPLAEEYSLDGIIVDAVSGTTGAGRKQDALYTVAEMGQNFKPYGVSGHRHIPEMEEKLSMLGKNQARIIFTPHLLPVGRGMMASIYVPVEENFYIEVMQAKYEAYYQGEPFVRVLPQGQLPQMSSVVGSNFCDIGLAYDKTNHLLKIFSTIDNLGKGACSQAVQALNLMCGFDETAGLQEIAPAI